MKSSTSDAKSSYAGMMSRPRRQKYADCEYVEVFGKNRVRLLTEEEKEEFRARIQRIIDPSLRTAPVTRRNIA